MSYPPGPPCLQRAPSGEHPVSISNWDGGRDLDLVVGISELSPFGRLFLSDGDGDGDGDCNLDLVVGFPSRTGTATAT